MNIETIGLVHSPFKQVEGVPIQPTAAKDVKGTIEIKQQFAEGLSDLDGFSHIVVLFGFHLSTGCKLKVKPFLDDNLRGVFSTRAPNRPSQIGLSIVTLEKVKGRTLHISGMDMIDGTPILDIKPYLPMLNPNGDIKIGWLENAHRQFEHKKADGRML
ncbi:MAG: tRNA (N6-threonylcarbamoyladenosine(37)-N6)-methyltransferase TrmO [Planctomycetes bacterium]|nr:tRNA (N6-threonylcarbamoyladenosine(37)-N6)-methyltransferase TrmO [Planctomycetota bacterium]